MKLPRYLQLSLVATLALVIWSQFNDETLTTANPPTQPKRAATASSAAATKVASGTPARANLFRLPVSEADTVAMREAKAKAKAKATAPAEPLTPPLPLKVLGAWWSQQQRIIILTDGMDTWPVCDKCKVQGKIWLGSTPVSKWSLVEVTPDHLLFEWQATHARQRIALDDFASEPKY